MDPSLAFILELFFIALTAAVMLVGLIGAVLPVLPGPWLIWLAALGYGLAQPLFGQPLFDGWIGGIAMVFITVMAIISLALDWVITHSVVAREGVSWQAIVASIGLGLLGLPFFPPLGPLAGAVLGLFLIEYFRHGRDRRKAWAALRSYGKGFGLGVVANVLLCLVMIGVWGMWVALALATAG
ncbi:MAG: DUF456 domain-containing protein [Anaerolineales bacterium]|nr:DUF456 domain-containing protein [Anaerolineales bacterium]